MEEDQLSTENTKTPQEPSIQTPDGAPSPIQEAPQIPNANIGLQTSEVKKPKFKKYMRILALALTVLVLIFAGYFVYSRYFSGGIPFYEGGAASFKRSGVAEPGSIAAANDYFGFDILKKLSAENDKNVVISPLSISQALALAYNGAAGTTADEMAKTMYLSNFSLDEINKQNSQMIAQLTGSDPKVELDIANSIWMRKNFGFEDSFLNTAKTNYNAEVQNLDFSKQQSVDTINNWVSTKTKGKIDKIIDKINAEIVMYIINAVYFKGTWANTFNASLTQTKPFTTFSGRKKDVQMMDQSNNGFMYFEDSQFQSIKLPYQGNKSLSMLVFLPKGSLSKFISSLDASNWQKWMTSYKPQLGTLYLPKFKVEYATSLASTVKSLGITTAFEPLDADFTKIRKRTREENVYINDIIHKTYIDVDEKGTEAAAVTAIEMGATGSMGGIKPKSFTMNVDKPFFFAIYDDVSGQVVFAGVIGNP